MLINSEDKSQPAAGDDSPSQLLGAFIGYLRSRTTNGDSESTGLDESGSEPEGVLRDVCEIGGVPAITLQPQVGRPDRTVLYFHGGGYVSGSPPERYLPLAAAVALAANARVHVVDYRLAPETPFPGRLRRLPARLSLACHAQRCGPANARPCWAIRPAAI